MLFLGMYSSSTVVGRDWNHGFKSPINACGVAGINDGGCGYFDFGSFFCIKKKC